jgi:hypothetical protein
MPQDRSKWAQAHPDDRFPIADPIFRALEAAGTHGLEHEVLETIVYALRAKPGASLDDVVRDVEAAIWHAFCEWDI